MSMTSTPAELYVEDKPWPQHFWPFMKVLVDTCDRSWPWMEFEVFSTSLKFSTISFSSKTKWIKDFNATVLIYPRANTVEGQWGDYPHFLILVKLIIISQLLTKKPLLRFNIVCCKMLHEYKIKFYYRYKSINSPDLKFLNPPCYKSFFRYLLL